MPELTLPLRLPAADLDLVLEGVGPRWELIRGKQILLTGSTGFVGKWLMGTFLHANRCLGLGARIIALSRCPQSFLKVFPELRYFDEIKWLAGDVRELVGQDTADCAFGIHAATDVIAKSAPTSILETCCVGTQRVLDAMVTGSGTRRLLLLSSGSVYGNTPRDLTSIPESWSGAPDTLAPASAYGEGKRISELLCAIAAAKNPSLEVSIARCFAFVGPHLALDKHFAIGNFITAAMHGEDICVHGDGTPLRSYLYAADFVRWLWVMLFDAPSMRVYNVGGLEALSIGALAHRVNRILAGSGAVRIQQKSRPRTKPEAYVPSIERIALELGLKPSVTLDDAILRTARWAGLTARM